MKKNLRATSVLCPCDSGRPYAACCAPWHAGLNVGMHAPSPEALMRSRYSAFVLGPGVVKVVAAKSSMLKRLIFLVDSGPSLFAR